MAITLSKGSPSKYIGLSVAGGDTKPTFATHNTLPGATYYEYDTGIMWITYNGTLWAEKDTVVRLETSPSIDIGDVTLLAGTAEIGKLAAGTALIGKVGIDQTTVGTTNAVVRTTNGLTNSGVKSADAAIKESAGLVYWLTVSDTAALAVEINDSTAGAGTDVWAIDLPAAGYGHFIFDPPIVCGTGIYLDVSTATCKVTIGYK